MTDGPAGAVPMVLDLLRPEAYPSPRPTRVELVTTHISWVFLTERDVFKIKRPVDYGFVDYSTLERRRRCCEAEVRLNRRLAPGIYRGVVPVRSGPSGHTLVGDGPVVDYAVHMRRLPDDGSAEALLRVGTLTHERLWRVADLLAQFYGTAPSLAAYGAEDVIRANIAQTLECSRPFVGSLLTPASFDALRAWQLACLEAKAECFKSRAARGHIRDGHGDLRLEHVYFEDGVPLVIDCVEFSEQLRVSDVASDTAFLAMELRARGRGDLAESFLGRFALVSNDYDLYDVVDFYLSYRALVRGMVAALLTVDSSTPATKAARKADEARTLFALAERCTRSAPAPGPVVAVGGLIGSGKTVLAEALARALAMPVVSSDRTRKWQAGIEATERAPATAYMAEFTRQVFDELFRRATVVLRSGRGVILDATFRERAVRREARELARRHGRRFLFVETTCDEATLRERLRRRAASPSVSDATEELLGRVAEEFEPVTELPFAERVVVSTTESLGTLVGSVRRALGT